MRKKCGLFSREQFELIDYFINFKDCLSDLLSHIDFSQELEKTSDEVFNAVSQTFERLQNIVKLKDLKDSKTHQNFKVTLKDFLKNILELGDNKNLKFICDKVIELVRVVYAEGTATKIFFEPVLDEYLDQPQKLPKDYYNEEFKKMMAQNLNKRYLLCNLKVFFTLEFTEETFYKMIDNSFNSRKNLDTYNAHLLIDPILNQIKLHEIMGEMLFDFTP